MIKKIFFCFFLIALFIPGYGQSLSDSSEISLLTADPGNELYSVFGHSAIRVKDPAHDMDLVFNYGTFDFNTPNFYIKFTRGKLNYILSISSFKHFMPTYLWENRSVYEQVLNLSQKQKEDILRFLQHNYLPENRYYKYDFFYDNCATRIRDLMDSTIPNLDFKHALKDQHLSFRDLIAAHLTDMKWNKTGIDIALGLPTDKKALPYEYMFLPDWMMKAFGNATIGGEKPLVKETKVLFKAAAMEDTSIHITPALVFWVIFFIGIIFWRRRKFMMYYDCILFLIAGLTGLLDVLLWFATDHIATKGNLNLLWAWPFHIFIAFYFKNNRFSRVYYMLTGIVAFLLLISWAWLPQDMNEALIPLVLLIGIRALSKALPYKDLTWTSHNQKCKIYATKTPIPHMRD